MGSRVEFIKKYADVNGRLEIILKNYPRFIQMVDGYGQCLSIIIRNERDYNRKKNRIDLGIRVQTSTISDTTAQTAIENVSIQEAIRADDYEKHAVEIRTLVNMREDYQILTNQFLFLEDKEGVMFLDYISKRRNVDAIADDEGKRMRRYAGGLKKPENWLNAMRVNFWFVNISIDEHRRI